jgi:hypothetical protein
LKRLATTKENAAFDKNKRKKKTCCDCCACSSLKSGQTISIEHKILMLTNTHHLMEAEAVD